MVTSRQLGLFEKIQVEFLPKTGHFRSLPGSAQRFSESRQTLQDFHQPLHGLIRGLMDFQPLSDYTDTGPCPPPDNLRSVKPSTVKATTRRPMERCREHSGGGMKHK